MNKLPTRLSTRFLTPFKILVYGSMGVIPASVIPAIIERDWSYLHLPVALSLVAFAIIKGLGQFRTVTWEKKHLVVKHRLGEVIILLEEVKSIELKLLIGVHEVTLYESHPYLGESFLFLASTKYLFDHNHIDEQMHKLRQHTAQAKRELV